MENVKHSHRKICNVVFISNYKMKWKDEESLFSYQPNAKIENSPCLRSIRREFKMSVRFVFIAFIESHENSISAYYQKNFGYIYAN